MGSGYLHQCLPNATHLCFLEQPGSFLANTHFAKMLLDVPVNQPLPLHSLSLRAENMFPDSTTRL